MKLRRFANMSKQTLICHHTATMTLKVFLHAARLRVRAAMRPMPMNYYDQSLHIQV